MIRDIRQIRMLFFPFVCGPGHVTRWPPYPLSESRGPLPPKRAVSSPAASSEQLQLEASS